jgi:Protein of unknown function (DUF3037)
VWKRGPVMPSYYSVIQFVPDPIANERINVGVVVRDESGNGDVHVLNNWNRVRGFLGADPVMVRALIEDIVPTLVSVAAMKEVSSGWAGSIQLTTPQRSPRDAESLLETMSARMLTDSEIHEPHQTKRTVAREAQNRLAAAIKARADLPENYVHVRSNQPFLGRYLTHTADVSLHNGQGLLAAKSISFIQSSSSFLAKEVELSFWALEDIRNHQPDVALAVLAAPPTRPELQEQFETARELYRQIDAPVVPLSTMRQWAREVVSTIPTPTD